ncbi:Peptidyl-tRNA hydrolase [Candida viswanathii]|uniref:Peptidyl-tRNA hydrolase n=1 Tax=Candida viswanathii TaxID=5486 RepID=A0A367XNW5_9ASCO|nr:Peptidyl-tRNA hydrolase [Candida viswanathii]
MLKHILSFPSSSPPPPGLTKRGPYSVSTSRNVTYVKSNTYMNESGTAWAKFKADHRRLVSSGPVVCVLYDDFEKDVGSMRVSRFRKNESHNGLKSLKGVVSREDNVEVYLLGVGIGPKPVGVDRETMAGWVLGAFGRKEKMTLENETVGLLELYVDEIIERDGDLGDVNKFNARMTRMWKRRLEG